MMNNNNKPKKYDAVLGGNNPPPLDGLVLGGIAGVKRRFDKANSEEEKISFLKEALKYKELGRDWLLEIIEQSYGDMAWEAFDLLWNNLEDKEKQELTEYLPKLLQEDILRWNHWRKDNHDFRIDFNQVNFSKLDLNGADLSNINFCGANLSQADLSEANLNSSDLSNANLSNANLIKADLSRVKLKKANLSNANLSNANLKYVKIYDFYEVNIEGTNFKGVTATRRRRRKSGSTKYQEILWEKSFLEKFIQDKI